MQHAADALSRLTATIADSSALEHDLPFLNIEALNKDTSTLHIIDK